MAIPTTMADLSTTAATNSPAGSESPSNGDDFLRAIQAIVRTTNAKGADIASATTTDIGAATGEFVDVTGTTTITGLGTIAAGIVRTVRFTGALTLTHNATSLILPSSANITTANGDVAQFRSLGSGNWKCTNYIRQSGNALGVTDGTITNAKLAFDGGALGSRNVLIGGSATTNPWQRGTSFTSATTPANNDDTYLMDRWYILSDGNDIVDVTKSTDAPTGSLSSFAFDVETVNKKFGMAQIVESFSSATLVGGVASLSFRAKVTGSSLSNIKAGVIAWSGTADTVTSDFISAWGADGVTPTLIANATFENTPANLSVTSSWATYEIENISIDTASTSNIIVFIWSDDLSTTLGDFLRIEKIQLEGGPVCTPFENIDFGDVYKKCRRFYNKAAAADRGLVNFSGNVTSGSDYRQEITFDTPMRSSPTVVATSLSASNFANVAGTITSGFNGFVESRNATGTGPGSFVSSWTASDEL